MWTYQSDTAGVRVPELDLELASGTLGGVVTTVEGLITKICESECFFTFAFHFDFFSYAKHENFLCHTLKYVVV